LNTLSQTIPVCIPARWAAQRFPGKLLQPFGDGTVLSHSIATATTAGIGPVDVLAADKQIEEEARRVGAIVHRVEGPWRNGSERIAAALRAGLLGDPLPQWVINVQGDAVGLPSGALGACVQALIDDPGVGLATCAVRGSLNDHQGRTTVTVSDGRALAFSRKPLPAGVGRAESLLLHLGIYAYRVEDLLDMANNEPGPLEQHESLEQLRWLEHGQAIAVTVLDGPAARAHAIDRPHDLEARREAVGDFAL
jgi:3-deoxy-manno-octulosonate cytidylyltransferase (CMP-KDO synthetase)